MTRKEKQITELYLRTTLEVVESVDNWLSFLKSASYNYKYRFDEQILIFAQRPDATACAETTIWNKKLKRWINKGSKGIALIDERKGKMGLRFVFDVSDTNSNIYGKQFKLWTAEEKYTQQVIETLEENFGTINDKKDIGSAIIETAYTNIQDNMQDYLEELKAVVPNSNLAQLDEEQVEYIFRNLLVFSTISLTLSRCGIDPLKYFQESDFADIKRFNTYETISILGTATRDFSKEILLEISKTIINVQKKERNINRTFVKEYEKEYDKNKENEKGSVEHEYNLQNERGLSNTRPRITRSEEQESGIRQVRSYEIKLLENEQEGNIYNAIGNREIDRPLDTNTRNSQEENTTNGRTNDENLWNNRENERTKPDGMGRTDEQFTSDSRTTSSERTNNELAEELNEFFETNDIFDTSEDNRSEEEKIRDIENDLESIVDISNTIKYLEEVKKAEDDNLELNNRIDYFINELQQILSKLNEKEVEDTSFFYENNNITQEQNKDTYSFMIGDSVFLGLQEFSIIDINNEKMTMYDKHFPLDQRIFIIEDILPKIAENPMNDYIKEREVPEIEEQQENSFNKWIDTFIEEKRIDIHNVIEIQTDKNTHFFEMGNIIENIKATTKEEQEQIKDMIVKIDFHNGDVVDYFKHLATSLAENFDKQFEQEEKEVEQVVDEEVNKEIAKKVIKTNKNIEYFDLHPEIPTEERSNFKISNDNLGIGTAKEKFRNNIEAIKVLKLCEKEDRYATVEEQEILSKYVGWGGLKSAFEKDNNSWGNEYLELKNLLTEEEYKDASESSLTAYYTPPVVIRNIYKALQNMGLKQANILEPSCRYR